jgi:RNA polymerase sigma-70 factor (ECF subfamily)
VDIEEQFHLSRPMLLNLAFRMVGNQQDAEDVLQEAAIIVHQKKGQFRGESTLSTWFFRIVANLSVKAQGTLSRQRINHARLEMESLGNSGVLHQNDDPLDALKSDPETTLIYRQMMATIRAECHYMLLGVLTREQRIVFLLRTRFDMSFATIASILQISESCAKGRMSRAVQGIKRDLREHCSLHSRSGECTCENCARYLAYKHPQLMHNQPPNPVFIAEINQALGQSDITTMYRQLLRHRPLVRPSEDTL